MGYQHSSHPKMTLYARGGERKYLNADERQRFYAAIDEVLDCPKERAFCKLIYWTGCRPSEALNTTLQNVVFEDCYVIICSLKKRGDDKGSHFRAVPVPAEFAAELDQVFGLNDALSNNSKTSDDRLFNFSRTTGWERIKRVMDAANLSGIRACARGLRHSFGTSLVLAKVPVSNVQVWMGHEDVSTTMIYLQLDIAEDRVIASRMWEMHREHSFAGRLAYLGPGAGSAVSSMEIIRLIAAYSAIPDQVPRLEFLCSLESQSRESDYTHE